MGRTRVSRREMKQQHYVSREPRGEGRGFPRFDYSTLVTRVALYAQHTHTHTSVDGWRAAYVFSSRDLSIYSLSIYISISLFVSSSLSFGLDIDAWYTYLLTTRLRRAIYPSPPPSSGKLHRFLLFSPLLFPLRLLLLVLCVCVCVT